MLRIAVATKDDVAVILDMVKRLAEYEKLSHAVVATEEALRETLFGERPAAEVLLARVGEECVGFAVFFQTYSTFLARPGIWLEDIFVLPERRKQGYGRALLRRVAAIAVERRCGRMEWSVLDWNAPAIRFYEGLGAEVMPDWRICRLTGDSLREAGEGSGAPELR